MREQASKGPRGSAQHCFCLSVFDAALLVATEEKMGGHWRRGGRLQQLNNVMWDVLIS